MIRIKSLYLDRFGVFLLIFSIVFSFFYSFGYELDCSQYDYLFYMHLVSEANYADDTMFEGTLFFYKPLGLLFGNSFWLWQRLHWLINLFIISIPYIFLLNTKQKKQLAFVQALAILLFCVGRCGCEPPRIVLLCAVSAISFFIKYAKSHDSRLVWIISMLLAFIAFSRFPSLFVYPLFVVAFFFVAESKKDIILIICLPLLIFTILVTLINGDVFTYFNYLKNNVSNTSSASPSHSILNIFMSEVDSLCQLFYFFIIVLVPFLLFTWKKKNTKWGFVSLVIVLYVMELIRVNPIPRWACAITMALSLFYLMENRYSFSSLAKVLLIMFVPMMASVGSNCGFYYDYVSVAFIPYLAINVQSIKNRSECYSFRNILFHSNIEGVLPALMLVVVTLFCSNLIVRFKNIYGTYYANGTIDVVNAGVLSPNIKYVYFSSQTLTPYLEAERDYLKLSKNREVIFWGMDAHIMSFINDKWPITRLWKVSSIDGDNVAMYDLEKYAKSYRPVVIDMEDNKNTFDLLSSLGYQRIKTKYYSIYK